MGVSWRLWANLAFEVAQAFWMKPKIAFHISKVGLSQWPYREKTVQAFVIPTRLLSSDGK